MGIKRVKGYAFLKNKQNIDAEGMFVTEDINADKISTSESDIIEVEVKWNDKVDTFTLKNE